MHPDTGRAMAGGLTGTVAMTGMMYMVAPMMGLNMDIAQMLGSMMGGSWAAGMAMHFVNGTVIFPLVKGAAWGVVLWLLAQTVVMPMMGAGFFSMAMGGIMAAMGSLVGHLLYGVLLGGITGGPDRASVRP